MKIFLSYRRGVPAVALFVVLAAFLPALLTAQNTFRGGAAGATSAPDSPSSPSVLAPQSQPSEPELQLSHQQRGDIYLARQRYQAAIEEYMKAEKRNAALWNSMGVAYQMLFDNKDAIRCYKQSIRLDPHVARVLNNLATVYDSQKEYGKAEKYFRKAVKQDPHLVAALRNLGTNLLEQGKYKEGEKLFSRAVGLDPESFFDDRGNPRTSSLAPRQVVGAINYVKARTCARAHQVACALDYLRRAIHQGAATSKMVAAEHDFDGLRKASEFQRLLAMGE